MTKSLKFGIISVFLFQLVVCASFGLAHDEAYYWLFSKNLSWGYFDHPPFVASVIALFSFLPHHEFSVRIGFVLLQAGSLFFLLKLVDKKFWMNAFLLFFSFPLASYSGLLALPDMPLLFMSACYFYFLREFLAGKRASVWILGVVIALLLYAKYHGILLIFFTLASCPRLVLRKDFWVVTLVSVILFLPHVWWQYLNNFPTLRYHFLERPSSSFDVMRILDYLGTQLLLSGLICGPIIWWQLKNLRPQDSFQRVLVFVSWGIPLFFLVSTFSKRVEANWTISLVIPLTILLSGREVWERKWAKGILLTSFFIVFLARIAFLFPNLPLKRIAEFHGWKEWASVIQEKCGSTKILANSYQIASKLSYYLNREVSALNYKSRKNQFDFWKWDISGEVCYITDKAEFQGEEILTPEGKSLKIVKHLTGENLMLVKIESNTRN